MDEVGSAELREERGDDIGKKDDSFGDTGANEIERGGEDDNVKDVID